MQPGDLLLVRTNHLVSKLIRFGQRGYGKEAARWNHVAVYIGNDEIVEALTRGIVRSPVSKYPTSDVYLLEAKPILAYPHSHGSSTRSLSEVNMRANGVNFAISCVGEQYGYATILAIALKVLFKGRWNFSVQGTSICSGLAARQLERDGYNWNPYDPSELTPAYLAVKMSP